jgi:hypothetical protein
VTTRRKEYGRAALALLLAATQAVPAAAYILNRTVPDKRNAANAALGTCPELDRFNTAIAQIIERRWNTTLGSNVQTVAGPGAGAIAEVRASIVRSFDAWASVTGTTLRPAAFGPLAESSSFTCSSADGVNTICFSQTDPGFTPGVLAFTNTVTSDILGEQYPVGSGQTATFIGEILDADVLFNPGATFATPGALTPGSGEFDLESILIHELGHFFGFSHSGVWRAIMYPFAPPTGTFTGLRPTVAVPDGPLADDDRTGLRTLYPDPSDTQNSGVISGRILPENSLSLAGQGNVTGIFGAHVVAVDEATGNVVGATLAGWSCNGAGPVQFDGSYSVERLPLGRAYRVYVEPLDGPVTQGAVSFSLDSLCRPYSFDVGYPPQFSCTRPPLNTNFVTRPRTP